jgi:hypothetical protein
MAKSTALEKSELNKIIDEAILANHTTWQLRFL